MNDEALAEHIIYLVRVHKEDLDLHKRLKCAQAQQRMQMQLMGDLIEDTVTTKEPSYTKLAAETLVNRIQAVLENRKVSDELIN